MKLILATVIALAIATPAAAQLGSLGKAISKGQEVKKSVDDVTFSDAEEQQIGSEISTKLRDKYGVVQDKSAHTYVTLVGSVLARASTRPTLKWTFIVLDTDGVNAFAAPGGFIHITRGALALIQNESELADVLSHEISHVTLKHTLNAIRNANVVSSAGQLSRSDVLKKFGEMGFDIVFQNNYNRKDEIGADELGVKLANGVGYAPNGLGAFLTRLSERNKGLKEPSGLFASHPDTQARLDSLKKVIASAKLTASALVAARYTATVSFKPVAVDAVAQTTPGSLGLGNRNALASEKSSSQTVSSAGSRGVNPDRDAKGGPNKALVAVSVTAAEIDAFKKGIVG